MRHRVPTRGGSVLTRIPPVLRAAVVLVSVLFLAGAAESVPQEEYSPFAATSGFYVTPNSEAATWLADHPDDPRAPLIRSEIADRPAGFWVGGPASIARGLVDEQVTAATVRKELPVLVAYDIPQRACGTYDGGGAKSAEEYRAYIRGFAAGIGSRPAVVVLEPDSLLLLEGCLDATQQKERLDLLRDAVAVLRDRAPATWVYLDGSDGRHTDPAVMAERLKAAGVADTRGFAVGVSNYNSTEDLTAYAARLADLLGDDGGPARALVDTSRNGSGAGDTWCNPAGRTLGPPPRVGGGRNVDAELWIKPPGTTDGDCGTGAGYGDSGFVPELAWQLLGRSTS